MVATLFRRWSLVSLATLGCIRGVAPVGSGTDARPTTTAAARDAGHDRGTAGGVAFAVPPPTVALALIYSSDVAGQVVTPGLPLPALGGLARRATLVDMARLQARAVFQVDAGDFLPVASDDPAFAAPAALERRAALVLAAYQRMDVDAVTLGARELQVPIKRLRALLRAAKQPVVLANVVDEKTGKPVFEAQRVRDVGGQKIGVFGIVELGEPTLTSIQKDKMKVIDPIAAAQAAVADARAAGATLVIGLFNLAGGAARAQEIAAAVPGIDVIVRAGVGAPAPPSAGGPLMVGGAGAGPHLGRLDAVASAPTWRWESHPLVADAKVPDQLGVSLLIRADTAVIKGLPPPLGPGAKGDPVQPENWTYGSTRGCAMCHLTQNQQWMATDHARGLETLKKKSRDRDPSCVGCHAVGFLQPGGTANLNTVVQSFSDVGCEACHGPSGVHMRSTDKRKGTSLRVDPLVCLGCHTPDQTFGPLDFKLAMKEILGPGHGGPQGPARQ